MCKDLYDCGQSSFIGLHSFIHPWALFWLIFTVPSIQVAENQESKPWSQIRPIFHSWISFPSCLHQNDLNQGLQISNLRFWGSIRTISRIFTQIAKKSFKHKQWCNNNLHWDLIQMITMCDSLPQSRLKPDARYFTSIVEKIVESLKTEINENLPYIPRMITFQQK